MESTAKNDIQASPFVPMFEIVRKELDEHHDRRERITKASRDITAASKKIIFALQRVRTLNQPLPANILKTIQPHTAQIRTLFSTIAPELLSLNAHRYNRQISPGLQEYMEARIFQHYLETQTIQTYASACAEIAHLATPSAPTAPPANNTNIDTNTDTELLPTDLPTDTPQVLTSTTASALLTPEDYILALFDATGEMMRFAITTMATSGGLPTNTDTDKDTNTNTSAMKTRTVVQDLQALRVFLSTIEARSKFAFPVSKAVHGKMGVMLASVEKVERALYGLIIRGSERPEGWMPDLSEGVAAGGDAD